MKLGRSIPAVLMLAGLSGVPLLAAAYEYPTVERVEFVEACITDSPNHPHQEMLYKCSCLIDQFAKQVDYDEFVTMSTAAKGYSIAGERGNALRDSTVGKEENKRYKKMMAEAKKSCFFQ
jgi:hypothetical protein